MWVMIDNGLTPFLFRCMMRATSLGVATPVTASPRHHAAAATVSDTRSAVLIAHGGQLAFLEPNLRVGAALAAWLLTRATIQWYFANATLQDCRAAILAFHEISLAPGVSSAASSAVIA